MATTAREHTMVRIYPPVQLGALARVVAADQCDTDPQYFADQAAEHERPRYRHDTTNGLATEAEVSGLQVSAGLLVTEICQAIIHAEGDAPAAWCYMRDGIIDDIVTVLVQVCNG